MAVKDLITLNKMSDEEFEKYTEDLMGETGATDDLDLLSKLDDENRDVILKRMFKEKESESVGIAEVTAPEENDETQRAAAELQRLIEKLIHATANPNKTNNIKSLSKRIVIQAELLEETVNEL